MPVVFLNVILHNAYIWVGRNEDPMASNYLRDELLLKNKTNHYEYDFDDYNNDCLESCFQLHSYIIGGHLHKAPFFIKCWSPCPPPRFTPKASREFQLKAQQPCNPLFFPFFTLQPINKVHLFWGSVSLSMKTVIRHKCSRTKTPPHHPTKLLRPILLLEGKAWIARQQPPLITVSGREKGRVEKSIQCKHITAAL